MQATHHPAQERAGTPTRRADGLPETDADRRFFDLREAGYTGWIDQDGRPATGPTFVRTQGDAGTEAGTAVPAESTPGLMTAADTFRAASLYLKRHGWIQGGYYDMDAVVFTPAACLVGALGVVCYGGPVEAPAQMFDQPGFAEFEAAMAVLDGYLALRCDLEAYSFNDAKGRTVEQVHEALHAAANTQDVEHGRTVLSDLPDASPVALVGTLTEIQHRATRQGHPYGTGTLTTGHGAVPVEIPSRVYFDNAGDELELDDEVWLAGMLDKRGERPLLSVRRIVVLNLDQVLSHVDYPHEPGRLYDCPACEAECFCIPDTTRCVHHAIEAELLGDDTDGAE